MKSHIPVQDKDIEHCKPRTWSFPWPPKPRLGGVYVWLSQGPNRHERRKYAALKRRKVR